MMTFALARSSLQAERVDEGVTGGKTPAQVQDNQAGVVNFSPYGNPANYVPPMQDTGQRVYDLGH